jgi:streptomycin 6-kinase
VTAGGERSLFEPWIARWSLVPDGPAFESQLHSQLLPVLSKGAPAILKIADGKAARRAADMMAWYEGDGAARVLAADGPVLLLERLDGARDLAWMACNGQDREAAQIICEVVARLHRPRAAPPPRLVPLSEWLRPVEATARTHGGVLTKAAAAAAALLGEPRESVPLHGDIHHRNILDGGERGWLAIDPWALSGERGFDYANFFQNPDIDSGHDPGSPVATAPGALARRLKLVSDASAIEPKRLLQWILAYMGLSAGWTLGAGGRPTVSLTIAEIAAAALES